MLRGLVIRQGFIAVEVVLGVLLLGIAISATRDLVGTSGTTGEPDTVHTGEPIALNPPILAKGRYNVIMTSGLFGQAGKYRHHAKPQKPTKVVKPVAVVKKEYPTNLPLALKGTVNAGVTNPYSSATIDIQEKKIGQKAFFIGDQVIEKVFLREIRKNEVLLENRRKNPKRMEVLTHVLATGALKTSSSVKKPSPKTARTLSSRPGTGGGRGQRVNTQMVMLDRADIVEKLNRDYERLASTLDVIEKKDEQGNLVGLTVPDIETIPVAQDLGFKNGDVLTSINNEKVRSQEQVTSLVNKYQNASAVRIGFMREGEQMIIMYRLR